MQLCNESCGAVFGIGNGGSFLKGLNGSNFKSWMGWDLGGIAHWLWWKPCVFPFVFPLADRPNFLRLGVIPLYPTLMPSARQDTVDPVRHPPCASSGHPPWLEMAFFWQPAPLADSTTQPSPCLPSGLSLKAKHLQVTKRLQWKGLSSSWEWDASPKAYFANWPCTNQLPLAQHRDCVPDFAFLLRELPGRPGLPKFTWFHTLAHDKKKISI